MAAGEPGGVGQGGAITVALSGDVMTGRGVDQILARPSDPRLYEPYVRSALDYVRLAEAVSGPLARPVDAAYVWGDALGLLDEAGVDLRIVNLETSVTRSDDPWPGKGIHYRMHPANVGCLRAARIDGCVLANNHVLDWGRAGLVETLAVLRAAALGPVGAGLDAEQARAPALLEVPGKGRVVVLAFGLASSGVPLEWAAGPGRPGVSLLGDLSAAAVRDIAGAVRGVRRAGDVVVVSLHWGGNWGYAVPPAHRRFAHALIEEAGVDLVHGHSSHHPLGLEVYRGRLVLYGCGDLLNDYEGIGGYEQFRTDLVALYLPRLDPASGRLLDLAILPLQLRRLRLNRASAADTAWLAATLDRESRPFGCRVAVSPGGTLAVEWSGG